jgi:hypothetical protein
MREHDIERAHPRAVADQRPRFDYPSRVGDLSVRHTEQDGVVPARISASVRTRHPPAPAFRFKAFAPTAAEGGGQRGTEAPKTDDRERAYARARVARSHGSRMWSA